MADKSKPLMFPMAGINRGSSFRNQAPFETRDALNVRGYGTLEWTARGGQRGGHTRPYAENLGGPIHMLEQVTRIIAEGESVNTYWYDEFDGDTDRWSQADWIGDLMPFSKSLTGTLEYEDAKVGGIYEDINLDPSEDYSAGIKVIPYKGRHWGTYSIYCRMDDTTPNATLNGVTAVLVFDDSGAVGGQLEVRVGGVLTSYPYDLSNVNQTLYYDNVVDLNGDKIYDLNDNEVVVAVRADNANTEFRVSVDADTISVTWLGVNILNQAVSSAAGDQMGMAMQSTGSYPDSACLVDRWSIYGYTDGLNERVRRTYLVASADGDLWVERNIGNLTEVFTDRLTDDVHLQASERTQMLYIADHGAPVVDGVGGAVTASAFTDAGVADWAAAGVSADKHVVEMFDTSGGLVQGVSTISLVSGATLTLANVVGNGTCSYRIVPGLKVYDPEANTLETLEATAGNVPANCELICTYRDRIVVARDHIWYMSRSGVPTDWDYAPVELDALRAVAGLNSDAGQIGEGITALIPFSDDYLIFGCTNSLWVLRGDPAAGGRIDNLSYEVGILSRDAWCHGSLGEVYFLSRDGIYMLQPGPMVAPQPLSRKKLPRELRDIDPRHYRINLTWDERERTVLIHATPGIYWAYSTRNDAFWLDDFRDDHRTYSSLNFKTDVRGTNGALYGCEDGYIRAITQNSQTDDGYPIESHADLGPFRIAHDTREGKLKTIEGTLAYGSGPVVWGIKSGYGSEDAQLAEIQVSGSWEGNGLQFTSRPRARGGSAVVRISSSGVLSWVLEKVIAVIGTAGRNRRRS